MHMENKSGLVCKSDILIKDLYFFKDLVMRLEDLCCQVAIKIPRAYLFKYNNSRLYF